MSDRWAAVVALGAAAGAWWAVGVPLALAVAAVGTALALRKPWLLAVAVALLASSLGARAWAGLVPAPAEGFTGEVTLVSDPDRFGSGVRVDVRAEGRRYEAWAYGATARKLEVLQAGERAAVSGSTRPISPLPTYVAVRHVAMRLNVQEMHESGSANAAYRAANWLRDTIVGGADSLDDDRRALFTGLVYGDDREQSAVVADDFRAAGLTHLLAVSGQNVAFALALVRPALQRLDYRGRWAATLGVLVFFAMVTRFEPSVLRATVMAGIAATGTLLGREASSRRTLALAVALLLLVDPLLVHSLAFRLSVLASTGIVLWAPALAQRIRGPRPLAEVAAVTIAAQLAVSPLLVASFGGVPVASLPANLLAAPVAGPVMMWGLSAGVLAGLLGGPLAELVHWPTAVGIGWIQRVGAWAHDARLGELRPVHLVLLGAAVVCWWLARRRLARAVALGAAGAVLLLPAVVLRTHTPTYSLTDSGSEVWRGGGAVVLVLGPNRSEARLLEDLRHAGVTAVDLAVASSGTRAQRQQLVSLRARMPVGLVVAPPGHDIGGARTLRAGDQVQVGQLIVEVLGDQPRLEVAVRSGGGSGVVSPRDRGARAPPV